MSGPADHANPAANAQNDMQAGGVLLNLMSQWNNTNAILVRLVAVLQSALGTITRILLIVSAQGSFTSGQRLPPVTSSFPVIFGAGLPNATGFAVTPPSAGDATFNFLLYPGGIAVASATFHSGTNTAVFSAPTAFTLAPGQSIVPIAPTPADPSLADVAIAWAGTQQ